MLDIIFSSPVASFLGFVSISVVLLVAWLQYKSIRPKTAPPRFSYLSDALSGKFDMKANGPNKLIQAGFDKLGECFSLQVLHQPITIMLGADAQAAVFALRDEEGEQRSVYKFTVPVFGPNIAYDAEPRRMAEQLRFLKFGLAGAPMKRHSYKIVEETQQFFDGWGSQERTVDLHQTMSELTINTASRALMGKEMRMNMQSRFADLYQTLSDGMTHLTVAFPNAPVKLHRERDRARKEIVTLFKAVIDKKRADEKAGHVLDTNEDMINFLMSKKYSNKAPVTDDDICGLLLATLFAGQHTSTITATWCGLEIIKNQAELMPKLLEEQQRVLNETNGELTYDALLQMELLYSCVKETLRKYPPLIALMRRLIVPLQFKDYVVPAGDIVAVVPSVAHKLDSVFKNPNKFDPYRFMDKDWDFEDQKKKWIPFGGGIHKCLGQKFGLLQVTAIWSVLIRNFDMKLVDQIPPVDYTHIVAGPSPTTRVSFKRKKNPMTFGDEATATKANATQSVAGAQPSTAAADGITSSELAKHNKTDDCYVAIHGKVYDVTQFLKKHPGGEERLMQYAGQDATFAFENQDHSTRARAWMKKYYLKPLI